MIIIAVTMLSAALIYGKEEAPKLIFSDIKIGDTIVSAKVSYNEPTNVSIVIHIGGDRRSKLIGSLTSEDFEITTLGDSPFKKVVKDPESGLLLTYGSFGVSSTIELKCHDPSRKIETEGFKLVFRGKGYEMKFKKAE